jgi:hypothetical protein
MQRLALMMAVMVLGMPQVPSCHAGTDPRMLWDGVMTEARVCPPIVPMNKIKLSAMGDQLDPSHWLCAAGCALPCDPVCPHVRVRYGQPDGKGEV